MKSQKQRSASWQHAMLAACSSLCMSIPVHAQTAPDAGRLLQENAPRLEAPKPSTSIDIQSPRLSETLEGGAVTTLKGVRFNGNSRIDDARLLSVLGEVAGKEYDLAGLRGLANQISQFYRDSGYGFARAYVPPQDLDSGELLIEILEGRYGNVRTSGDAAAGLVVAQALGGLKAGEVIENSALERSVLIADDLPGIRVAPILRPGQEVGTGDLDVVVTRDAAYSGMLGVDNHGNRYTGYERVRFELAAHNPLSLGDELRVNGLYSAEDMWLGGVNYSLPVGPDGVRLRLGYSQTAYYLAREFADLKARGSARTTSANLSWPLLRSQQANLGVALGFQHKALRDRRSEGNPYLGKSSELLTLNLNFDRRDQILGGGVTYGSMGWSFGQLDLGAILRSEDTQARTNGRFERVNLDLARIQNVGAGFLIYGRLSGQWSNSNLDSSEKFGLGGANGVRAYPSGEAFGDRGWLAQAEIRYQYGAYAPYIFYDAGLIDLNADPWVEGKNRRRLSGGGFGLRYQREAWSLDAAMAWRGDGGKPTSDTRDHQPLGWVSLEYRF